ncbi:DUF5996 family protein [Spirillospora sp. CA-294931]|uniref:DUF5996 family protein n=1 Tax=Spirillospora sp. CA-294931 TaxID=3240042 RepID=UPI003D8BA9D9
MEHTLPGLPWASWSQTKDTLHLWTQIVGKIQLGTTAPRNHWWHTTLHVTESGFATGRMTSGGTSFSIAFDLAGHRLVVRTAGAEKTIPLRDGLSVAEFYRTLLALLRDLGISVEIKAEPFGVPMTTPFAEDTEHASYDPERVEEFRRALEWADGTLREFQSWFCGKSSPVQLYWHSFDLATARFSGRPAPVREGAGPVESEAYSHEVISAGWWAGDPSSPEPAFYSYTHPEPGDLVKRPLSPDGAFWAPAGTTHQARLDWSEVLASGDPRDTVLDFLQSAYAAGAVTAGWPYDELHTSWCPPRGIVDPSAVAGS